MAGRKNRVLWRDWLFHHFIAVPLNFLFTTHRKTTITAIIMMLATFGLAIFFPPFIPALITFKLINFAPFAFMATISLTAAALTTSGLAGGATVLVIKALYLAELAVYAGAHRMHRYFYPEAHRIIPPAPIMKAFTMQALFKEFQKATKLGTVLKVKKNHETAVIDGERLVLSPESGAEQVFALVPDTATPVDYLAALNANGYSIFKNPKPGSKNKAHALSPNPRDDQTLTTQIINTSFTY